MSKDDGAGQPSFKPYASEKANRGETAPHKLTFVEFLLSGPEISDEMAEIINRRAKKPSRKVLFED